MATLRELAFSEIRGLIHPHRTVFSTKDPASKVLGELKETGRYEAVVRSDGKIGLVTVRDLLGVDQPEQTKIDRVWRITGSVSPALTLAEFARLLIRNNVRAMPVAENGEILGCVSQVDVMGALTDAEELEELPVKGLMRRPVDSLDVNERISLARRIMLERGFSHIPIVEYGRLVGIVTAEIIVHHFITPIQRPTRGERIGERVGRFPGVVGGIMDIHPLTAEPESSVLEVVRGLTGQGKSACIIVDKERAILGIVTPRELLTPLAGIIEEEDPPVYIVGISEEDFFEKGVVEEKVRRAVKRGMKMHPHINEISIRVKSFKEEGSRKRYELRARILSPTEQFTAEAADWELMTAFDKLCDRIDRVLSDLKHEPQRTRARRTTPSLRG
ncbi:CBS domain-containing protein [Candidatus Bathyarchaeota archaeon]|nr:CBS domain-containing protein [Candidatus Bathyarchaeota archaeon]